MKDTDLTWLDGWGSFPRSQGVMKVSRAKKGGTKRWKSLKQMEVPFNAEKYKKVRKIGWERQKSGELATILCSLMVAGDAT